MGEYEVLEDFWAVDNRNRNHCFHKNDVVRGYLHPVNPFVEGTDDTIRVKWLNGHTYGKNGADYCFVPKKYLKKIHNAI